MLNVTRAQIDVLSTEFEDVEKVVNTSNTATNVELRELGKPTLERIRQALDKEAKKKTPYNIIHYIGHSEFDVSSNTGNITLCTDTGNPRDIEDDDFAGIFQQNRTAGLALVVLDSCEGGFVSGFNGLAMKVLQRRTIPCVIAMQFKLSDRAGRPFASKFYEAFISNFEPEKGILSGREILFFDQYGYTVEFISPVLYMVTEKDRIFNTSIHQKQKPKESDSQVTYSDNYRGSSSEDAMIEQFLANCRRFFDRSLQITYRGFWRSNEPEGKLNEVLQYVYDKIDASNPYKDEIGRLQDEISVKLDTLEELEKDSVKNRRAIESVKIFLNGRYRRAMEIVEDFRKRQCNIPQNQQSGAQIYSDTDRMQPTDKNLIQRKRTIKEILKNFFEISRTIFYCESLVDECTRNANEQWKDTFNTSARNLAKQMEGLQIDYKKLKEDLEDNIPYLLKNISVSEKYDGLCYQTKTLESCAREVNVVNFKAMNLQDTTVKLRDQLYDLFSAAVENIAITNVTMLQEQLQVGK